MKNPTKIIPRTMAGLRDTLFGVLEGLRDGNMVREDAKEMANVARVIIESVDVQLNFEQMKLADEVPQHMSEMSIVPPLNQALENKGAGKP